MMNGMPIGVSAYEHEVPMCYPFLPDREISREELWRRNLFIPQFWPEVLRRRVSGFARAEAGREAAAAADRSALRP